jgi:outer membrane protein
MPATAPSLKEFLVLMKRAFALLAVLGLALVFQSSAQTAAPAAAAQAAPPAKVAVIAFQIAVAQTNEGQRDFADLQKKFEPRQAKLKALSDEIDTLTKQLQTQAASLSEAEQQSRANAIDTKKKQLQRDGEDAQTEVQQAMQEMYNGIASKVYDVLEAYSQLKGYTLVLDISEQQSPVLWAADNMNITKDIIDAYNQKSGVPAPPAAPAASLPAAPKPAATPAK